MKKIKFYQLAAVALVFLAASCGVRSDFRVILPEVVNLNSKLKTVEGTSVITARVKLANPDDNASVYIYLMDTASGKFLGQRRVYNGGWVFFTDFPAGKYKIGEIIINGRLSHNLLFDNGKYARAVKYLTYPAEDGTNQGMGRPVLMPNGPTEEYYPGKGYTTEFEIGKNGVYYLGSLNIRTVSQFLNDMRQIKIKFDDTLDDAVRSGINKIIDSEYVDWQGIEITPVSPVFKTNDMVF